MLLSGRSKSGDYNNIFIVKSVFHLHIKAHLIGMQVVTCDKNGNALSLRDLCLSVMAKEMRRAPSEYHEISYSLSVLVHAGKGGGGSRPD